MAPGCGGDCADAAQSACLYNPIHSLGIFTMPLRYFQGLMWFRRDLRAQDNAALHHALAHCEQVLCVFVLDKEILDSLPRADRRVEFIRASLIDLEAQLRKLCPAPGKPTAPLLMVRHAWASQEIPALAQALGVQAVFTNHDYEPQAIARDAAVRETLARADINLHTCKDQVIFECEELLTQSGKPYGVFTPYKNAWLKKLAPAHMQAHVTAPHAARLRPAPAAYAQGVPTLAEIGFEKTNLTELKIPTGQSGAEALLAEFIPRMDSYHETRNFPAIKGPSYLGMHLRFGTVSIRALCALAHPRMLAGSEGASVWLSELIWRDFYAQILANFPHVARSSFKPDYDAIAWETDAPAQALFAAWCEGRTGYPIVDAAMAQINQTGYMHNRLRMVVASFLTKDLGLDWRWGERYFAEKLNDFDLASNNGGWQWASSSGCDAQPYFRIFNPSSQSERFDAQGKFIRRYLPQLAALPNAALHAPWDAKPMELQAAGVELGKDYPQRVVAHDAARLKTLQRYAVVKKPAPSP
jgi:deoxyribodipyrimidine photo-lyase